MSESKLNLQVSICIDDGGQVRKAEADLGWSVDLDDPDGQSLIWNEVFKLMEIVGCTDWRLGEEMADKFIEGTDDVRKGFIRSMKGWQETGGEKLETLRKLFEEEENSSGARELQPESR